MSSTITVPDDYHIIVYIAAGAIPLLSFLHGLHITTMRFTSGILYPNAYATPQQAKASSSAYRFNCAQRAHAQYLENMPQTMVTMLIAGLEYPKLTAGLGLAWLGFRVIYYLGYVYSTAEAGNGRMYGVGFWFAQGGIWALSLLTAWNRL